MESIFLSGMGPKGSIDRYCDLTWCPVYTVFQVFFRVLQVLHSGINLLFAMFSFVIFDFLNWFLDWNKDNQGNTHTHKTEQNCWLIISVFLNLIICMTRKQVHHYIYVSYGIHSLEQSSHLLHSLFSNTAKYGSLRAFLVVQTFFMSPTYGTLSF